jgi:VanZ family protein
VAFLPERYKGPIASSRAVDAGAHVIAYFVVFRVAARGRVVRSQILAIAAGLVLWGVLVEFAQTRFFKTRTEYTDMIFNGCGVALGLAERRWRREEHAG